MPITVVLLAAGYATRLYPLTKDRPKALLPLGRVTMLDEVVKAVLRVPHVGAIVLVTNHRFAEQFRQWQQRTGTPVEIVDDGTDTVETRLGAIRDLELARKAGQPGDDVLVIGTDNLFTWPLAEFVTQAKRFAPKPSIALWKAPSKAAATQFGVVIRDATGRITSFVEKSKQPPSEDVALCVYYFPAAMTGQIQQFLDSGGNADAPGYFIQWLVREGIAYGIMMPGAWYDIGSLESYETVQQEWPSATSGG